MNNHDNIGLTHLIIKMNNHLIYLLISYNNKKMNNNNINLSDKIIKININNNIILSYI